MNHIHAYEGVPRSEILKQRMTTKGQKFTLNHPRELIVSMRYTPTASNKNSQGWERDQKDYWATIRERYPQCLDSKNLHRIENNNCPRVNKTFIDSFPQYRDFKDQQLFHHHIGGYGDAVAAPKDLHTGYGGIHNIEKQLHITENAQRISRECRRLCAKDQKLYGKKSIEFQKLLSRENNKMGQISSKLKQFRQDHGEPGTTSRAAHEHNITPEKERASVREQVRDNYSEYQNKIEQNNM